MHIISSNKTCVDNPYSFHAHIPTKQLLLASSKNPFLHLSRPILTLLHIRILQYSLSLQSTSRLFEGPRLDPIPLKSVSHSYNPKAPCPKTPENHNQSIPSSNISHALSPSLPQLAACPEASGNKTKGKSRQNSRAVRLPSIRYRGHAQTAPESPHPNPLPPFVLVFLARRDAPQPARRRIVRTLIVAVRGRAPENTGCVELAAL